MCKEGEHTELSLQLQSQGLERVESCQSLCLMVELGLDIGVSSPMGGHFLDLLPSDSHYPACQGSWPLLTVSFVPQGSCRSVLF